jgi:curved DNA-binding protein CbpA
VKPRQDPFALLGLPAGPGLTDDDVRSAWRRVAAATHPDRADGGDPERFAAAAAAYTALRTPFGRGEALADLRPATRRSPSPRPPSAAPPPAGRPPAGSPSAGSPSAGPAPRGPSGSLTARALPVRRLASRVRRGRPVRLALRVAAAAAAGVAAVLIAGARPATPALITGAVTWLALTARRDLAPPP